MKRSFFFLITVTLFTNIFYLTAQSSRIPKGADNWLQLAGTSGQGDRDGVMTIIFEVPDTVPTNQLLYIGINSPGYRGSTFDAGKKGHTEFYLVGGSGALSHPSVKRIDHSKPDNTPKTSALEGGVLLDSRTFTDENLGWVYFTGVYPTQGEHIGNRYYFRVVAYATGSFIKNAFQADLSSSMSESPTQISGVRSFGYCWSLGMGNRIGHKWSLHPFIPESSTGKAVFWNHDFDEDEKIEIFKHKETTALTPLPAISNIEAESGEYDILPADTNKSWRIEITENDEFSATFGSNPGEVWAVNKVSGELYRIYSDEVDYSAIPPHSVILRATDGKAVVGGVDSETLTLQIVDSAGNPVPYSRKVYVTVGNGAVITEISAGTNNGANALITTDSEGAATFKITKSAPAGLVRVTAFWDGTGGSSTLANPTSSAVNVQFSEGLPPTLSSAANSRYDKGAPSTVMKDVTIKTAEGTVTINRDGNIELMIPADLSCTFDSSVTNVTFSGSGVANVNTPILYKAGGKIAVINVNTNFNGALSLTISGLKLTNFTAASHGRLRLSYDGGITFAAEDDKVITIFDNAPPLFNMTRAAVGSNKIYVEFSASLYRKEGGAVTSADFSYTDNIAGTIGLSSITDLTGQKRIFIFELTAPLTDENIVADTIAAKSATLTNSNGAVMTDSNNKISDIGVNFFSDLVLEDLQTKGGSFRITSFKGGEIFAPEEALRITAVVDVNHAAYSGVTPVLHYKSFPNHSAALFWEPAAHSDDKAVTGRALGGNRWEFLISGSDSHLVSGRELSLVFSINGFYCYQAGGMVTAPTFNPKEAESYTVKMQTLISQSGGVTITNNVINPGKGDQTTLHYSLEKAGPVSIVVYDLKGNVVEVLVNYAQGKGEHTVDWAGRNLKLRTVARGVYFIRVRAPGIANQIRKVLVVK